MNIISGNLGEAYQHISNAISQQCPVASQSEHTVQASYLDNPSGITFVVALVCFYTISCIAQAMHESIYTTRSQSTLSKLKKMSTPPLPISPRNL